jgi:FdhD protein
VKEPRFELWPTQVVVDGRPQELPDPVAVEEPLEIRVGSRSLVVTMRTPGHDGELAAGWLYGEGLVDVREDVIEIREPGPGRDPNQVDVLPRDPARIEAARSERTTWASSACGVCGKTAIEQVFARGVPALSRGEPRVARGWLEALPERMRAAQPVFAKTGGLHAAALFQAGGELLVLREDVGRHNAVDKVVGERLLAGALPAHGSVLVSSGRAGFEIVQKAARAGIPIVAAVGAPSSLALRVAERSGITLVGFLRRGRFNLYTMPDRVG